MIAIMSECNFTATQYSPAKTSIVKGIRVQATKPVVMDYDSTNSSVAASNAPSRRTVSGAIIAITIGVVSGLVILI